MKAKADAQVLAVDPALEFPNVTLLTNAYVERLETTASGRAVSKVIVRSKGEREEYSADIVVVSAGAIQLGRAAPALGERPPPGRAGEPVRRGRPALHGARQLRLDGGVEVPQPHGGMR